MFPSQNCSLCVYSLLHIWKIHSLTTCLWSSSTRFAVTGLSGRTRGACCVFFFPSRLWLRLLGGWNLPRGADAKRIDQVWCSIRSLQFRLRLSARLQLSLLTTTPVFLSLSGDLEQTRAILPNHSLWADMPQFSICCGLEWFCFSLTGCRFDKTNSLILTGRRAELDRYSKSISESEKPQLCVSTLFDPPPPPLRLSPSSLLHPLGHGKQW